MITGKEIRANYRIFNDKKEANETINNRKIMKRPGVYLEDDGEKYSVVETFDTYLIFQLNAGLLRKYEYDNLILDYLFEDLEVIGVHI